MLYVIGGAKTLGSLTGGAYSVHEQIVYKYIRTYVFTYRISYRIAQKFDGGKL